MTDPYAELFAEATIPFSWDLTNFPAAGFGSAIMTAVTAAAKEKFPDLADMFPFRYASDSKVYIGDGFFCASVSSRTETNRGGDFSPEEVTELSQAASHRPITRADLAKVLEAKWTSPERFTYIGPYKDTRACWPHLVMHLDDWMVNVAVPDVVRRNQQRVERAIPPAPTYDVTAILRCLWVVESEQQSEQGTAFQLSDVGLITCAHVLHADSVAFQVGDEKRTPFPIRVVNKDDTVDLAVFTVEGRPSAGLRNGTADDLQIMDHLLVAGFPNYRWGDSGYVAPGLVTGFRTVSAIRRLMTNAPIIKGNSGGPVLSGEGNVIGVAATGAESMQRSPHTENHSVIPIDALKYILHASD